MTTEHRGVPRWMETEAEPLSEDQLVQGNSPSARTAQMILAAISDGRFKVGERLPSERALAEALRVGRSAIREALSALEILGVVEVMAGSGTYVRSATSEILPRTLSWGLLIKRDSVTELVEVRQALEVRAVQLAVERMPDLDLSALVKAVDDQRTAIETNDTDAYVRADQQFHIELARLSNNEMLGYLASSVRGLLRVWIERQVHREEDMRTALAEHAAILAAVRDGDEVGATQAMARHMKTSGQRLAQTSAAA
ncbi:Probable transcriptional regulator YvfI [Propionibacterium freudenreichii]|uniref:FadR/GntR family transcriptional regulator n=1 Tax=Propionibacterium freudenreichii TaxID=1744 RepID=UPI000541BD0B|nr:FadR/GntR family transcriptional regulator [Propionibacterium freudenreichii]CEG99062.1 Probable transcriptional regulator YvfI [Propionibacterium freudenreichii]CEI28901.1 Probable transcriptional regulator YvfI [Propionibacterium freudenreichii]